MKKAILAVSVFVLSSLPHPSVAMNLLGQELSGNVYGERTFNIDRFGDGTIMLNTSGMNNTYGNPETVTSFSSAYRPSTGQYTVSYTVEFSMDENYDFGLSSNDWGGGGGGDDAAHNEMFF